MDVHVDPLRWPTVLRPQHPTRYRSPRISAGYRERLAGFNYNSLGKRCFAVGTHLPVLLRANLQKRS